MRSKYDYATTGSRWGVIGHNIVLMSMPFAGEIAVTYSLLDLPDEIIQARWPLQITQQQESSTADSLKYSIMIRNASTMPSERSMDEPHLAKAVEYSNILPSISWLLDRFQAGASLARSQGTLNLAREVVSNRPARESEDIDAWADAIANKISEYDD